MNTIERTTLEVGDLVHHEGKVWIAERMDTTRPCEVQCAMHDGNSCHGYCFRWDNGEDFVFRFILPDMAVKEATTIVATPDPYEAKIADDPREQSKAKYYAKVKAQREQRDVRPYGTGSLAPNRNSWRGEIYVGGEHFTKYDPDKAVVLAWLDDMNAKKQALAKMDKLKGKKR